MKTARGTMHRSVAFFLSVAFLFTYGPMPMARAAEATAEAEVTADELVESAQTPQGKPAAIPYQSQVGVFSGHSWAKSWGSEEEKRAWDEWSAKQEAQARAKQADTPFELPADQLRPDQVGDDPETDPVYSQLRSRLSETPATASGLEANRREFLTETGAVTIGAFLSPLVKVGEALGITLATTSALLAPTLFGQLQAQPPTFLNWVKQAEQDPAARRRLEELDQRIRRNLDRQVWEKAAEETRSFFAALKMAEPITDELGIEIQGYRSYKREAGHPDNQYIATERFWVYDMGVTITYLIRRGEVEEARWLAERMLQIADQMKEMGEKGGWRFSHGAAFTDHRSMSGGTAWVFKGLYAAALTLRDPALLNRINGKLVEIAFPQQVMDSKDPRYGLFRAGFGSGGPYGPSNDQREEITTEHNWDYIEALRLAHRANRLVNPTWAHLDETAQRHDLAMRMSREKLFLTEKKVTGQFSKMRDHLRGQGKWTTEVDQALRQRYGRVIQEIRALPEIAGQKGRWTTGMDSQGLLNLSWAWDNEGWSPHSAYDEDQGYRELKNLEFRFLKGSPTNPKMPALKGSELQRLPADTRIDSNETFMGLIFFTADFDDPHVGATPEYEQMIQLEATWGYIFRLIQLGYHTSNQERRDWAYGLAARLIDSILRLHRLYGGAVPYATRNVKDPKTGEGIFSTMRAIASNSHQGVVLEEMLSGGVPADEYLNALPHPDLQVGGKAPVWAASEEPRAAARRVKEVPLNAQHNAFVEEHGLAIQLPRAIEGVELAGKWAMLELQQGPTDQYQTKGMGEIPATGILEFQERTGPDWREAVGRRILIFENQQVLTRQGTAEAALVVIQLDGRPGFRGQVLARAILPAAPAAPKAAEPAEPEEMEPTEPEEAEPTEPEPPVEPAPDEEPQRQPAQVQVSVHVTPSTMTLTLSGEAQRRFAGMFAEAEIKTDVWYSQDQSRISPNGRVSLSVVNYVPNSPGFPGWVAAKGRRIIIRDKEFGGREVAVLEVGDPDAQGRAIGIVVEGTWPGGAPAAAQPKPAPKEKPEPAPPDEEPLLPPAPAEAPAVRGRPGQNWMEPFKAWVQADPNKHLLPLMVWSPRGDSGFFDPDTGQWTRPGFFERAVEKAGATTVVGDAWGAPWSLDRF